MQIAQLGEFISQLPIGLSYKAGERCPCLSSLQHRPLFITRAFYHEPSELVLDEPTRALNTDFENSVIEVVLAMNGGKDNTDYHAHIINIEIL